MAKQIEGLLVSLKEEARNRLPYGIRDRGLAAGFRTKVQALLVWAEVWHSLAAGKSPAEIALPLPLTEGKAGFSFLNDRPADVPSSEPWLTFGLTEAQWRASIHDLLLRAPSGGTVAASNALSRDGIQTIGDFYERWRGDVKFPFGIIRDFGRVRLAQVKQALKEAGITWPAVEGVDVKVPDLGGDKPWEAFGMDERQWEKPLADVLIRDPRGSTYQPVRVRNILAKAGCVTVGELYLFCQGRKSDLLKLRGMSETRLIVLDNALKAVGIPPLN